MNHVDPELLALLALGEQEGDAADLEHLASCDECRLEVEHLARTAIVGRSTLGTGDLLTPRPAVWQAIVDELGPEAVAPAARPPAEVIPLRRRLRPVLAVAAAVAVLAGGITTWIALRPDPSTVIASATLDPFPDWDGAEGSAVVATDGDGGRTVEVSLSAPGDSTGFREVWLISSDATRLVSLGILRGDGGVFTIPDGLDLGVFDLVDISEEPYDGDPTHSGDSIVRGALSES